MNTLGPETPTFETMAEVFIATGGCPPGITASEAILANYRPRAVRQATNEYAYRRITSDEPCTDAGVQEGFDKYDEMRQLAANEQQVRLGHINAETNLHLDKLVELAGDGHTDLPVEGTDLLSGLLREKHRIKTESLDDHSDVAEALDDLSSTIVAQAEAEVKEAHHANLAVVAAEVQRDITRLSIRGRYRRGIAGAFLGLAASAGLLHLISESGDASAVASGMISEQQAERVEPGYQPDLPSKIVMGVLGSVAGAGAARAIGMARQGQIAHKQARRKWNQALNG